MKLAKLFETQKELRDRIGYEGEDRFEKLVLALQVEIGECANEWRGFKFWSKNQEPRTSMNTCEHCNRLGRKSCTGCYGKLYKNPLLEEYVDGLHFVLELGLEEYEVHDVKLPIAKWNLETNLIKYPTISKQFNKLFNEVSILEDAVTDNEFYDASDVEDAFENLLRMYIGLGEMLGFTWEQIEQAYYAKNQVNHERQNSGY
ncbi:dUTP diphosphatase [Niallia taxi]|uniref:dUTP diphosphatase n=1 Tax=Niallia taxi TaxID=2499688 RepID=UPI0021A96224|nr:dUTP diphosphatase [Niallia taxi]MCT2342615.1 dUTP diphosphatase [Niallia taxi]